ncbi:hypothetical protein J1614_001263 [Plenodomus biglobosus]|nr:hypothetical protein J1614_001263 [Plenodomus biglobosus]
MSNKRLPEFILFGDSLTEWSFDEDTQGFGWHLRQRYAGLVNVVDEGRYLTFALSQSHNF